MVRQFWGASPPKIGFGGQSPEFPQPHYTSNSYIPCDGSEIANEFLRRSSSNLKLMESSSVIIDIAHFGMDRVRTMYYLHDAHFDLIKGILSKELWTRGQGSR